MKKKYIFILLLLIGCIAILWGYIRFNERVTFRINNQGDTEISWQWTCNSIPSASPILVSPLTKLEATVYPSCEGELGILFTEGNEKHHEKLIGYVPVGKPIAIDVSIITANQIKFRIDN